MTARLDTHVHLIPDAYRAALVQRELTPYPLPAWSPELTWALMERHAIDAAVLSLSPPGVSFGDQGLANELARMVNETTAALVREAPDRLGGMATVPLPGVDDALAEVAHALDNLKLDGVILLSNVLGTYLGDPVWDPLFDELDRRGAYVLIHPHAPPYALPLPAHPIWLYEYPFDTTRAVVQLIYSGTLERCPHIRFQLSHLGGTAPYLAHRLASLAAREPAQAAAAPAGALDYLSCLYYDTGLADNAVALAAMRLVAPLGRIVFGSDWPYAPLPPDGDPAPGLEVLGTDRSAVDHRNAAALVPRLAGQFSSPSGM
jgi:predicted TIM-barrel fold metal-dependent hydrolase